MSTGKRLHVAKCLTQQQLQIWNSVFDSAWESLQVCFMLQCYLGYWAIWHCSYVSDHPVSCPCFGCMCYVYNVSSITQRRDSEQIDALHTELSTRLKNALILYDKVFNKLQRLKKVQRKVILTLALKVESSLFLVYKILAELILKWNSVSVSFVWKASISGSNKLIPGI